MGTTSVIMPVKINRDVAICVVVRITPETSGGNKTPQTENSKPVNSNTQQNPTETEDNSAKPEPTPISAKRQLKIRKNKATLKEHYSMTLIPKS